MGIYTVEKIPKQSPILPTADAPSIIVTAEADTLNWAHHDYSWKGEGQGEFEADNVFESVMTFGALSNYHAYLYNVKPKHEIYDDTITPQKSPGIGAYSYHAGYKFFANQDIPAGEEIFVGT